MAWATLYIAWGLSKPRSISNMYGSWLSGIPKKLQTSGSADMLPYLRTNILFFAGIILDYTLAPYLDYPSIAYFFGGACCGISVLGAGGQGFFFCSGTWMAV